MIAPFGDQTVRHGLFKPFPLEHRRFIKRCRRVRIVLEQFRRTLATIGKVHSPIEISVLIAPAFGDIIPKQLRDPQPAQNLLVVYGTRHDLVTQALDFLGRPLQIFFDLARGKLVVSAIVPAGNAFAGKEFEAVFGCRARQIGSLGYGNSLHGF